MNIFVLDTDPVRAAQMQCDKHVVKMIVESAQMLCNALPLQFAYYERTHFNHPCSVWVRASRENYLWLCEHALELCHEYTRRYKKTHSTEWVILLCISLAELVPSSRLTPFVICVPDDCKTPDPVESYRLCYLKHKSRFAKWRFACSPAPAWYQTLQNT